VLNTSNKTVVLDSAVCGCCAALRGPCAGGWQQQCTLAGAQEGRKCVHVFLEQGVVHTHTRLCSTQGMQTAGVIELASGVIKMFQ